jgi:hypothetical protein
LIVALGAAALAAGCGAPTTTRLAVDVAIATGVVPTTVDVTVFDDFGEVGHAAISPAPLPGQVMLSGLPDKAADLRIAAVGTGGAQLVLGGTRATVVPHQLVTASITLAYGTPDGDNDGVPDSIDDCPSVADPTQKDSSGHFPGDACVNGAPPQDMATTGRDGGGGGGDMARAASTCATAGVAFCDGFESPALAAHWTNVQQVGGSAVVDDSRAYRGGASLHLHNDAVTMTSSDVELDTTLTTELPHFYARAFIYVPSAFAAGEAPFMLVEQGASPYQGITLDLRGTSGLGTQNTLPGGGQLTSNAVIARDQWVCVEWNVKLGSAANNSGSTDLTVDGTAAPGVGGAQTLYATPAINQFGLALIGDNGTAARDLWIDELEIDTSPIGCAK